MTLLRLFPDRRRAYGKDLNKDAKKAIRLRDDSAFFVEAIIGLYENILRSKSSLVSNGIAHWKEVRTFDRNNTELNR